MMLVYHGSYCEIEKPDLKYSRANLDFGKGFYVTPIKDQAVRWTEKFQRRNREAIVNTYELHLELLNEKYLIKEFKDYNSEWLHFILACRSGSMRYKEFDMIVGGVANDKIYDTLELFFDKLIDEAEALGRLKYHKPNNQICIINQMIVNHHLIFKGSEKVNVSK